MLTGKEKRFLRSLAQTMRPTVQLGKNGLNETFIASVRAQLDKRELLKISVLQNQDEAVKSLANTLVQSLAEAQLVQDLGRTIVIYAPSPEQDNQVISQQLNAAIKA